MPLDAALSRFAAAFAAGSQNVGTLEYRTPGPIVVPIPLGPAVQDYFARLRFEKKPMIGGELLLMLFTLDELESAQYGWRWVRDKTGIDTENPKWDQHWIIIADRDGDAIFVDDSTDQGAVWGSIMQRNFKIADDLASFFDMMAEAMTLEADTFNYEVIDDESNVDQRFLDAMQTMSLRLLGSDGGAGFMKFFFS